ncbi:hypothetical protein BC829DRAFT_390508 [Chytridium lagenaria]|nr:hypothetical protein BC829DRAFT_390508 [Chytridium lagenaria]
MRFARISNMTSHLIVHKKTTAADRRFACVKCDTCFLRSHDLHRHMRTRHSDLRPHLCGRCGKTFSRADSLRKHMEVEDRVAGKGGGGKGNGKGRGGNEEDMGGREEMGLMEESEETDGAFTGDEGEDEDQVGERGGAAKGWKNKGNTRG